MKNAKEDERKTIYGVFLLRFIFSLSSFVLFLGFDFYQGELIDYVGVFNNSLNLLEAPLEMALPPQKISFR